MAFFYRYDAAGDTSAGTLNTNYFISRGLAPFYIFTQATGTAGSLNLSCNIGTLAGAPAKIISLNAGTTYHIAMTHDQGHQTFWLNGIPTEFGTKTGGTKSDGWPIDFGVATVPGTPFIWHLHDFALWNGYVLTAADVAALRDGSSLPPDIGTSATWRGRWTMAGTPDATVTAGNPGIANFYGDAAYNLVNFAGTGSAVYSAPLIFEAAAAVIPKVMTSGKTIGFVFKAISGGATTNAIQALLPPTIKKNGANLGELINPWLTGQHPIVLYGLPSGQSVGPADVVTISAPPAWMNTQVGIAEAMTDKPATNCAGRSAYGVDVEAKTFRPGWNFAHLGFQNGAVCSISKNWRHRSDAWSSGTVIDANGRAVSNVSGTSSNAPFHIIGPQAGIDGTISFPSGLWAVGWDDLNTSSPTTMGLLTTSTLMLSITPRPEFDNPGVAGIGKVKVFDVQQLRTTAADALSNAKISLFVTVSNAAKTFSWANDVVYGPGDFVPGTPTVLDRSDPMAVAGSLRERFANGVGVLRWIDVLFNYGAQSSATQPEHIFRASDWSWGLWNGKFAGGSYFTQARPWDPATTRYIYGTLFGSPYSATLATPIDAVATVLNISDAATAPLLVGLRLKLGTELVRILSISGTSVTVERGACNTTPASHSAGTIEVQYRWDTGVGGANVPGGQVIELVSATPHGMDAGQTPQAIGNWPAMTFADGSHPPTGASQALTNYKFPMFPTGPNTVMLYIGKAPPRTTLNGVMALDSTCRLYIKWPDSPAAPIEFAAHAAATFPGCALHFSLPHACTDSLAWLGWRLVRDNYPPDRPVYFECSDEPWNQAFTQAAVFSVVSSWLYPATHYGWEWYLQRVGDLVAIGRAVWTAAGRDPALIRGMLNSQIGDAGGVAAKLEFAKTTLNKPIDLVAIATYLTMDTSTPSQVFIWNSDDEQALDWAMADFRTNPNGYTAICANMNAVINSYNTAHGEDCGLYGYEGGMYRACPPLTPTITAGIDDTQVTVPVSSAAGLVRFCPLLIGSEWVTVMSVAGNVLTVTRGAYGSTAAAHANGTTTRTAYVERSHDMMYNPCAYFWEQEHYSLLQEAGFVAHNTYAIFIGSAEAGTYYGAYHIQTQQFGYGNGLDGKLDNRLTLACPGKANSKGPLVDQDAHTVSVRGQAFLDWMSGSVVIPPIDPTPAPKRRFTPRQKRVPV